MEYPSWDPPLIGGGTLIGIVAILHVFVAHFAVGGGIFLVLTEGLARRERNDDLLRYVRRHARFFVLVVLVFGAVSGVGIWWTIATVHPSGTSALLRTFLWAWAVEWVLFLVEIVAALVYYYGWDRLDAKTHLRVGWIYAATSWLSLAVVNGILTFMLTPGAWLETRSVWDGFFNPTMMPSLILRSAVAVALGGLYALLTIPVLMEPKIRHAMTRYAAAWVLAGSAILPFAGAWYVSQVPPLSREVASGGSPPVMIFATLSVALSALIVGTAGVLFWRPRYLNLVVASFLGLLGLGVTAVTEWVREAVRKPWIIYGYMYSNSIRPEEVPRLREEGVLRRAEWAGVRDPSDPRAGAEIFRIQCRSCHTVDGFNGIRPMVRGWREEFIDYQLRHLDELKGYMPPFAGTAEERRALARWLHELGRRKPFGGD